MRTYSVTLTRTVMETAVIDCEAGSSPEAQIAAEELLEHARDLDWRRSWIDRAEVVSVKVKPMEGDR